MDLMESRVEGLFYAVRTGTEDSITPGNNTETIVKEHAQNLRDVNNHSGGKVWDIIEDVSSWPAKSEIMRFLSTLPHEDWDRGIDLAQWMMTSEVGFDFGVLTRILNEAKKESLPIEWVAAAEMDEKKFRFDENGEDLKVKARKRQHHRTSASSSFDRDAIMAKLNN